MDEVVMYAPDRRSTFQRWRDKAFPWKHLDAPEPDPPFGKGDVVFTNTVVHLGLFDRLRVLWTGNVMVLVRTATEHPVGATKSISTAFPVTAGQLRSARLFQ